MKAEILPLNILDSSDRSSLRFAAKLLFHIFPIIKKRHGKKSSSSEFTVKEVRMSSHISAGSRQSDVDLGEKCFSSPIDDIVLQWNQSIRLQPAWAWLTFCSFWCILVREKVRFKIIWLKGNLFWLLLSKDHRILFGFSGLCLIILYLAISFLYLSILIPELSNLIRDMQILNLDVLSPWDWTLAAMSSSSPPQPQNMFENPFSRLGSKRIISHSRGNPLEYVWEVSKT